MFYGYYIAQVPTSTDITTTRKTTTQKQQKNRRKILHDITSISNSLAFDCEDTPVKTVNDLDKDNVTDDDESYHDGNDDFGGLTVCTSVYKRKLNVLFGVITLSLFHFRNY